jgi:hypothetical protein
MKRISRAAAVAVGVIWPVALTIPAAAQDVASIKSLRDRSKIKIEYVAPQNPKWRPVYERLMKRQVLERLQGFLAPLQLPRDLSVRTSDCGGQFELPYRADAPVTICYEYVDLVDRVAPPPTDPIYTIGPALVTREIAIVGPFVQIALHNVARAMIDTLELPVWGNIDDAADNLSAYIMLRVSPEVAQKTVFGSAFFFMRAAPAGINLADTQLHLEQRYYNLLCIAVGSDLVRYSMFVPLRREPIIGDLPKNRLGFCLQLGSPEHSEYSKVRQAFEGLILTKHVDRELLRQVRAIEWLKDD